MVNIPQELMKYVVLTPSGDQVDRFKCPVPGCDYSTRLGPGALRMHMILKADPNVPTRHDAQHEEYLKQGLIIDKEQVKILGEIPRKDISA